MPADQPRLARHGVLRLAVLGKMEHKARGRLWDYRDATTAPRLDPAGLMICATIARPRALRFGVSSL